MGEAGAKYVARINVQARVQWSVGNKIMDYTGNIVDVPSDPEIVSSSGLRVNYPARDLTADDMYACSVRNIRYYLQEGALPFKEIREI
jgi:hypothetical protein